MTSLSIPPQPLLGQLNFDPTDLGIPAEKNMSPFAITIMKQKYAHDIQKMGGARKETWYDIAWRVAYNVLQAAPEVTDDDREAIFRMIASKKFMPGGRYLYASGRPLHQTQNCLLLRAEDSREGWSALLHKAAMALMTGAGIGVDYSDVRAEGSVIARTGGKATGPLALMQMVNEAGRHIMQGGARRSAIWAGLRWDHPDVEKFINIKNWSDDVRRLKQKDFNFPACLDGTNVSVLLDDKFITAYNEGDDKARRIYGMVVHQMLSTAEPGFSIDLGDNTGETLRNACTEVTSRDDSDICNLGSLNLARISTPDEFRECVRLGSLFLLAGTLYSDIPYAAVGDTRTKNRRLGLGLMGVHEWLLQRGYRYEQNGQLAEWMSIYQESGEFATKQAAAWGISAPLKTRALAPTGTIGIVAETTTGIEPIFCVAFRRRYLDGQEWRYQYVVDPTAKRLIDSGVKPDQVEDAYDLAEDYERRLSFQAWMQQYVDHAISSTINLPSWGSETNNEGTVSKFADTLMKYLPLLRGITCYPDGCRNGQPLSRVKYETAIHHIGQVFVEGSDVCDITGSGSCGT